MPVTGVSRRWRWVLLATGIVVCCWSGTDGARAQGLDMDGGSPPSPASPKQAGLDMDVSPGAPSGAQPDAPAVRRDDGQDGIVPPGGKAAAAARPPAEPMTLDHPQIVDTATLRAGDATVALYGIEGLTGAPAQGLQGFLAAGGNRLTCQVQASADFVCLMADGTDIAQVALVNGAARAKPDAPDSYHEQEVAAQTARRGVWVNLPPPPETVRHPLVRDTATLAAEGRTFVLDGVVGLAAPYNNQLQGYIAGNGDSMTCSPQSYPGHYICLLPDGTDIAKVALVNGAAQVAPDAPDSYRMQQADALNNRRGYWFAASQEVVSAASLVPRQEQYVLMAGDEGVDGISYIGGAPVALIEGESVFLVYGDSLGWGYYDHYHHWRGAPDRFRNHMEHFHPGGSGLRGRDGWRGGHEGVRSGFGGRPALGGRPEPVGRPGIGGPAGRPGLEGPHPNNLAMAGRPGVAAPGAPGHPGGNVGAFHPSPASAPGGFVHPGPAASAGGFHPNAAPAMHAAAPSAQVAHASAPPKHR
jgi:endonuclease YncB( thermonuclease family)